ncbi:sugar ABC transporter substrate-binding protein, partial [Pseudoalteromonas phenolica]
QSLVINEVAVQNVDAFLVSPPDSAYLGTHALKNQKKKTIPVLTFDSELFPQHQQHSLAYNGTNKY